MSRYLALAVVFLACRHVPVAAQAPTHKIEATDHQAVAATITYEVRIANFTPTRLTAFLPVPPELPSQTKVKTTAEPAGKVVAEKSPLARKVHMIDVPAPKLAAGAKLALRMDVQAVLRARKLVPLADGEKPPAVAALTAIERKYYLAPSQNVDFDKESFRTWLDVKKLRRTKTEPPVEFAARVLAALRENYEYRYDSQEDKRASWVCERPATDCGGLTHLFVGAMRANDVPARVLIGRLAKPRKPGTTPADPDYDQPHARAEVYVGGVGWVPADPSYATVMKDKPVTAYLGDDHGDMLVLHVDVDLRLPFPDQERTVTLIQVSPNVWATGRGKLDIALTTGWEVTTTPLGGK